MWSSLSAPILIWGATPVRAFKLSRTLYVNWFRDVVPAQSVHLSCSMDNDISDGDMVGALEGAESDRVTTAVERDCTEVNHKENTLGKSC